MMQLLLQSGWRFGWITLAVLLLDQITKIWVIQNFSLGESVPLLPVFSFTYARNYGAAFSFLGDAGGWQRWLFTGIAIVVTSVMAVWLTRLKRHEWRLSLALVLIIGGAIGNLIDRLTYGYVVDFFTRILSRLAFPSV